MERINRFREIFISYVKEKREEFKEGRLKKSVMTDLFNEASLSNEDIVNEIITLYFGGTDTTANLLTAIIIACEEYPEYKMKMVEEMRGQYKSFEDVTFDTINDENIPITKGIINETLRIYTPAVGLFYRQCIKDTTLGDIKVKKGTQVNIIPFITFHNEKYFPNPKEFNPYRWINNPEQEEILKKNPYAFLPFSAGNRNCVGQHFARMETKMILAYLCLNYDWEMKEG